MPEITLHINGKAFGGWKSGQVTRGIEAISGGFDLSVSDRWESGREPWAIHEEDRCAVRIGNETLITGYVDKRRLSFDAGSRSIEVAGRDRTGDLVDCSAVLDKWEYLDVPVLELAQKAAAPFGVTVKLGAGIAEPPPARKISVDPGDSAFTVLERLCRAASLLPVSDGLGGLALLRPGSRRADDALVEGENVLAFSGEFDATGRYRRYVLMGQHAGSDKWFGEATTSITAEAYDSAVRRAARVLVVRPEGNLSGAQAKTRAEWEATVRAARATSLTVRVQGWTQSTGKVWPVNALVAVRAPHAGVKGTMLISQATYRLSESSTETELTLRPPSAFKPEPLLEPEGLWKEIAKGV
ncbi:putative tail protein [Myxococcus stipitatus DSM 14675]|uniref:Putative tail protein n=1 Tax=Myxococcus stipitatus (strain DSM 14675 / JCM 12634 / Mx s8) TaxID=1278073 RepID=L7U6N7_MYXSD|nr:tail protein [Myxococcus stipitatus]AGC43252.1 putative tail protein [Myxococcus stipitatus DSM 14675]